MKWISVQEITSQLERYEHGAELSNIYALSRFWRGAIYPENYVPFKDWSKILTLSEYGNFIRDLIISEQSIDSESELLFVIFRIFTYHHIMIDPVSSDIDAVQGVLKSELQEGKIILPYRFGRLLYDRFNDSYLGEEIDHLVPEAVANLLAETPKGVYQLDKYLTGPLGLIISQESRYLPPSNYLPLRHCSDTGCLAPHDIEFLQPELSFIKLETMLKHLLRAKLGPPSEWFFVLTDKYLARREDEKEPFFYYDLPVLIAESIIGNELTLLLTHALKGDNGKGLRTILGSTQSKKEVSLGKAEEVAARLSGEAQLQLLLVLPDAILVDLIDQLTETGTLKIPYGQKRSSKTKPPSYSMVSLSCELSRLGMRAAEESPIVTLVSLIYSAYKEQESESDLKWKLQARDGISLKEALVDYLRRKGPKLAVQELVLSTPKIANFVCIQIRLSLNRIVSNTEDTIDRILWKIGFNPPQYNEFSKRFAGHIDKFHNTVISMPSLETEDQREIIRAAGVNLFVYLEKFIDNLIAYNI